MLAWVLNLDFAGSGVGVAGPTPSVFLRWLKR